MTPLSTRVALGSRDPDGSLVVFWNGQPAARLHVTDEFGPDWLSVVVVEALMDYETSVSEPPRVGLRARIADWFKG